MDIPWGDQNPWRPNRTLASAVALRRWAEAEARSESWNDYEVHTATAEWYSNVVDPYIYNWTVDPDDWGDVQQDCGEFTGASESDLTAFLYSSQEDDLGTVSGYGGEFGGPYEL